MSKMLLISENEVLAKEIAQKLMFLRANDEVVISSYKEGMTNLKLSGADIVFVVQNTSGTLELIDELRCDENLCIILLASSNNSDFILEAYDRGVDDFALANSDDFELVLRTVNNIKHNSVKLAAYRNTKILTQMKIVDELSGMYNYEFAKQVFENKFDEDLKYDGVLLALSVSESSKMTFSMEKMAQAVKKSIRIDDIPVLGRGANIYILLSNTDLNGAIVVLNKIKENYGGDICCGMACVEQKDFIKTEQKVLQALSDALATNAEYVFAKEEENTLDDWLYDEAQTKKNYKIFRQMFNKKLEKVITPVFFRLQKAWEEKLFNTAIEQYVSDEQCVFSLKNKKQNSTLRIIYPGFSKIIVSITHEGLDSPENSEIQLQLSKITLKGLSEIVEEFIKEFKNTIGD